MILESGSGPSTGNNWEAVCTGFRAQAGRDLIRRGDSLHVIRVDRAGAVRLIPAASWHWEGSHDPETWTMRATAYGPSTSITWSVPASSIVVVRWGSTPGQPYTGTGPASWTSLTARLQSDAAGNHGGGTRRRPQRRPATGLDRLPARPAAARCAGQGGVGEAAFNRMAAACGCYGLFEANADGTARRESLRQWFMGHGPTARPHGGARAIPQTRDRRAPSLRWICPRSIGPRECVSTLGRRGRIRQ